MKLQLFNYENNEVRVVEKDDEPWFVASDVCKVLELKNTTRSCSKLLDHEKGLHSLNTIRGMQSMIIISESGVYKLIVRSDKEKAVAFQNWLFGEVLPSIRKTGSYSVQPVQDDFSSNPIVQQAQAFLELAKTQARIEREQAAQRTELAEVRKISLETKEKLEKPETIEVTHYTVVGWAKRLNLIIPDDPFGGLIGRKLSSICRLKGIDPEEKKLDHGKHGYVNRYPKEILETHFIPYYEEALAKREEKKAKTKA